MAVTLEDIDRLLDVTSAAGADVPVERVRTWRDELAHVAVLLAYARHVLSVDLRILRQAADAPSASFASVVDSLPETLASAALGGGWSLAPDAPATMVSAERLVEGEADGLLGSHQSVVRCDISTPADLTPLVSDLESDLDAVTRRWETAEARLRTLQAQLVTMYKSGQASVEDWLR